MTAPQGLSCPLQIRCASFDDLNLQAIRSPKSSESGEIFLLNEFNKYYNYLEKLVPWKLF